MQSATQVKVGRVRLIFIFIVVFALTLVYRLYSIQIVSGEAYIEKADRQYVSVSPSLQNRGTIFFTSKDGSHVTAAYQQTGSMAVLNPTAIPDKKAAETIFDHLSPFLSQLNREDFFRKAAKKTDQYEEIAKRIDADKAAKITASGKLTGLDLYEEKWRAYPAGKLAANVLGFMAYKGDDLVGQYGLERQYESLLERTNESMYTNFFVEMFSDIKNSFSAGEYNEGDIVTTIEPNVQSYLEQTLEGVNKQWNSEYTAGIIMDPMNGDIIAMAKTPTFDPNNFSGEANPKIFSNPLVEDVNEMGSIVKPLTMAAGLDTGVVTAKTIYNDAGFLILNGSKISNYDGRGRGFIDMQQVLNQSLNTGAAYVAQKLGNERFTKYMKAYGLAEKTGIDLPSEAAPLMANLESPREIEHATASYGQGIAMTPVATVRALAVLANGGKLVNPHIVSEINYRTGLTKNVEAEVTDPAKLPQVLKPATSEEITRMLVRVVDEALAKGTIKIEHYSVAAKTGTAEISQGNGKGYYADRYLHSFFGYFPAYNPKFIIFLYTYYPKNVQYASETLTGSFHDLTKYLINYYDVPPDR